MREPPRTLIASPVLHDKSSNLHREGGPSPDIYSEDRVIRYRDGRAERERGATVPGMSYSDTAQFIRYDDNPRGIVAGHVDMSAYLAWLDANGYALHMGVR